MKIDIFSDIVCPWCYLGQARMRAALKDFPGEVEVSWRPFQLDPSAPVRDGGLASDWLREKFGGADKVAAANDQMRALTAAEGLPYEPGLTRRSNTVPAHRVVWLAGEAGDRAVQDAVVSRLFRAHHAEGLDVSDEETLAALAGEAGLPGVRVREMFASQEGMAEIGADLENARALGITGVPFFLFEGQWAVSGAQSTEVLSAALTEVAGKLG
ncbi:DsbA family oxidoreductase [Actinocorallia aurantiaca]|uniref:DsbA family oxidoreductase n=1 Tax=Actinocorallia aurantiaca TaxID=46204 RepID=A0ABP6H075_9ACTN